MGLPSMVSHLASQQMFRGKINITSYKKAQSHSSESSNLIYNFQIEIFCNVRSRII
jgi:hypothetical protein